jgi:hypothetical protein
LIEAAKLRLQHSGELSVIILSDFLEIDWGVGGVFDTSVEVPFVFQFAPMEVTVDVPTNPTLKRPRVNRNVSQHEVVKRPTPTNVIKVWEIVGEFEQVMVSLDKHFPTVQTLKNFEIAAIDDHVTKVIDAVFDTDNSVPVFDERFGHLFGVVPRSDLGSVVSKKLTDSCMSEVRVRRYPCASH